MKNLALKMTEVSFKNGAPQSCSLLGNLYMEGIVVPTIPSAMCFQQPLNSFFGTRGNRAFQLEALIIQRHKHLTWGGFAQIVLRLVITR